MKIIGIESSSLVASVALVSDDTVIAEYTVDYQKTHSQTLLPMLDEILRMTETDVSEADAIAVAGGPGSFTGLRIGAATAKGLGLAAGKPLIHVPTVDAMAYGLFGAQDIICPIMDAKRGQVYTGLYRFDDEGHFEVLQPAEAVDIREILEKIEKLGGKAIFLGDGVPVFRETVTAVLGEKAVFAPAHVSRQRAASVAALGLQYFREGKTVSASDFAPEYFRISQAERERNARLAAEKQV